MNWLNTPTYAIERSSGRCAITGNPLTPGEPYIAALVEDDPAATEATAAEPAQDTGGLRRVDVSLSAWEQGHRPQKLFSYWRSTVPHPQQKKKLFVDDEVLVNLLQRLADADEPQRLAFRFVLALILMRKKLLRYDTSENRTDEAGQRQEWWTMTLRGAGVADTPVELLNPQMNDEQIRQVTEQLGQILEAEL